MNEAKEVRVKVEVLDDRDVRRQRVHELWEFVDGFWRNHGWFERFDDLAEYYRRREVDGPIRVVSFTLK